MYRHKGYEYTTDNDELDRVIAALIEATDPVDTPIGFIANPTPTSMRIVFADSAVCLTFAEAICHASALLADARQKERGNV